MARTPRHKHHSRRARPAWAFAGAFVASTAFVPSATAPLQARELTRRLESLRIVVPSETRLAQSQSAPAVGASERPVQFDIPAGSLSSVVADIERISAVRVVLSDPSIANISSSGLSGRFTPLEAIARVIEGTSVTMRPTSDDSVTLEIRLAAEQVDVTAPNPLPRPSSPKYAQPLIEVPQTIEVIPREVMEAQGVTTLSDALRNVPGISLQAGEGGGASNTSGDMFNLRGLQRQQQPVRRWRSRRRPDLARRVQPRAGRSVHGPDRLRRRPRQCGGLRQHADEGAARAVPHYEVTYGYGSADQNRATVDLNQRLPLGEATAGSSQRRPAQCAVGGRRRPGRDVVAQENKAIAPSIALGLSTPTRVTLARADHAPGQRSRLRHSAAPHGLRIRWRPTTVHRGTARRFGEFLRQRRLRLRRGRAGQLHRPGRARPQLAAHAPESDALQPDASDGGHHHRSEPGELRARHADGRRWRVRATSARTRSCRIRRAFPVASRPAALRHAGERRDLEIGSEEQFAPTLDGARNPRSRQHLHARTPSTLSSDYALPRGLAYTNGKTKTVGVYAFDTRRARSRGGSSAVVCDGSTTSTDYKVVDALGAVTTRI